MSCCNGERAFVYMIVDKGSGGENTPQRPPSIIVDQTTMLACSPEDVKQRALYQLAQADAAAKPEPIVRDLARLEVLVTPFCA